ncbi:hypothetical protein M0R45_009202 [Rubus argutus]|uniref:Uncharacterized protein n=1 Tax=Rubus argutus TaxID=59490 RepID=A0AAW1Y3T3_RUBAR
METRAEREKRVIFVSKNSTIGGAGNGIDDDYGAKRDAGAITAASIGGQRSTYGRRGLGRCDFVALQVNGNSRDERETECGLWFERERRDAVSRGAGWCVRLRKEGQRRPQGCPNSSWVFSS